MSWPWLSRNWSQLEFPLFVLLYLFSSCPTLSSSPAPCSLPVHLLSFFVLLSRSAAERRLVRRICSSLSFLVARTVSPRGNSFSSSSTFARPRPPSFPREPASPFLFRRIALRPANVHLVHRYAIETYVVPCTLRKKGSSLGLPAARPRPRPRPRLRSRFDRVPTTQSLGDFLLFVTFLTRYTSFSHFPIRFFFFFFFVALRALRNWANRAARQNFVCTNWFV